MLSFAFFQDSNCEINIFLLPRNGKIETEIKAGDVNGNAERREEKINWPSSSMVTWDGLFTWNDKEERESLKEYFALTEFCATEVDKERETFGSHNHFLCIIRRSHPLHFQNETFYSQWVMRANLLKENLYFEILNWLTFSKKCSVKENLEPVQFLAFNLLKIWIQLQFTIQHSSKF